MGFPVRLIPPFSDFLPTLPQYTDRHVHEIQRCPGACAGAEGPIPNLTSPVSVRLDPHDSHTDPS